jgi:hypothetical protein
VVSDGEGGVIVCWQDWRNSNSDIYAQRIDATGASLWMDGGTALCTEPSGQATPRMIADGAGGVIVGWADYRSGHFDIYAQRVDASGNVLWTADGIALCTAARNQQFELVAPALPTLVSDGTGGAIVSWLDYRAGGSDSDIYAQRVDASGNVLWATDGVVLCSPVSVQWDPAIVSDGAGGAIVAWADLRTTQWDVYAQRVSASGTVMWDADGIALCTAANGQYYHAAVSDGAGGAIVTWADFRRSTANNDVYAQRVDASGVVQWGPDGIALSTVGTSQWIPKIASDGAGGAIVTWYDNRSGVYDIYAQRVDASATVRWGPEGLALCTAANTQDSPAIAADGAGGAVVVWSDDRSGEGDIYAQRVDAAGAVPSPPNGFALCTARGSQSSPTILWEDGVAYVAWEDFRSGGYPNIYAQRVKPKLDDLDDGGSPGGDPASRPVPVLTLANHPNPFSGSTELAIGLPAPADLSIEVYDVAGRRVRMLTVP